MKFEPTNQERNGVSMSSCPSLSLRNRLLRKLFRVYPFSKGRYRLMRLLENMLDRKEHIVSDLFGRYRFLLNLGNRDLESTFYYFMPERYEPGTQQYIRQAVRDGMLTLDIGAHIGLYTVLLAHQAGPSGRVYSFEPELKNFTRLQKNVELNQFHQVRPFRIALSDTTGLSHLILNEHSNTGHALKRRAEAERRPGYSWEVIQTLTLDEFVEKEQVGKIDLMKIDTEGSEDLVLAGGWKTFSGGRISEIICEIHSSHNTSPVGQDKVRALFYAQGYHSYILDSFLSRRAYLSELLPGEPVTGLQNLLFKKP